MTTLLVFVCFGAFDNKVFVVVVVLAVGFAQELATQEFLVPD